METMEKTSKEELALNEKRSFNASDVTTLDDACSGLDNDAEDEERDTGCVPGCICCK